MQALMPREGPELATTSAMLACHVMGSDRDARRTAGAGLTTPALRFAELSYQDGSLGGQCRAFKSRAQCLTTRIAICQQMPPITSHTYATRICQTLVGVFASAAHRAVAMFSSCYDMDPILRMSQCGCYWQQLITTTASNHNFVAASGSAHAMHPDHKPLCSPPKRTTTTTTTQCIHAATFAHVNRATETPSKGVDTSSCLLLERRGPKPLALSNL